MNRSPFTKHTGQITPMRRTYRLLFAEEGTLKERIEDVAEEFAQTPLVQEIVSFIRAGGDRAICTPRSSNQPEGSAA